MNQKEVRTFLKGAWIGGTMLVPGVSGGSMAMILGIYDELIASVSSFFKDIKRHFIFLSIFSGGAILGMIAFAKPISHLLNKYPMPVMYFFVGAVVGSIPLIYKKSTVREVNFRIIFYTLLGLVTMYLLAQLPTDALKSEMHSGLGSFLLLVGAGFVAAIALILPGISVSYMLLLMGMYDETMRAIGEFYLPFLVPLGLGLLIGVMMTTKILERAMSQHPQPTYLIILGFMVGSTMKVFPGIPAGAEIIICLGTFLAGVFGILLVSTRGRSAVLKKANQLKQKNVK